MAEMAYHRADFGSAWRYGRALQGAQRVVLEPHATTLDSIVAATTGGALEARQIDASNVKLISESVRENETEGDVLVIGHIHTRLRLKAEEAHGETVRGVHGFIAVAKPLFSPKCQFRLPPKEAAECWQVPEMAQSH